MLALTSSAAVAVKSLVSALGLHGGAGLRITSRPAGTTAGGAQAEANALDPRGLRGGGEHPPGRPSS
jgi:hypothetical protein